MTTTNAPHFQQGLKALKSKQFEKAQKYFSTHEETEGTATATQKTLKSAAKKFEHGDVDGAAELWESLLDVNPSLGEIYVGLARVALVLRKVKDADLHASIAIQLAPELSMAWVVRGLSLEAQNQHHEAHGCYVDACDFGPKEFLAHFNLGRFLIETERAEDALEPLERALQIEPQAAAAWHMMGLAHRQLENVDQWIESLQKATLLAPENALFWMALVDSLVELKRHKDAQATLKKALKAVDSAELQARVRQPMSFHR